MAQQKNSNVALCPECEGQVKLSGKLQIGQKLTCRRCGSALVIVDRKPLELDLATGNFSEFNHPKTDRKKDKEPALARKEMDETIELPPSPQVLLADCPECSATLRFHKALKEHQLVVCPECEETLEVVSLRPFELGWANEDPGEYAAYNNSRRASHHGQI